MTPKKKQPLSVHHNTMSSSSSPRPEADAYDNRIGKQILSDASPGDRFEIERVAYILTGVDGGVAQAMRLVNHTIKVSQEETAEREHGIERLEMPLDTAID